MAIRFLSGQTIDGALSVTGNVQAATFNGLAINTTGTNNVANQIVRTQANGYANFGWINSVSGNHTGTITRITASNDAYLRYVTPAQFRTGVTDGFYAPASTVSGVTSVATGNGLTGGTITSTGTLTMSGSYTGIFTVNEGQVWDPTTPGLNKGSIHIDPDEGTDHAGGAITWGASDASSGNTANAGIYIRSDGSYGTKMYLATTDSYATGSKTALNIDHSGNVNITRGFLQVSNGNITLAGTGRIQGVDTVSASTDAANKAYVDAHPGSGGTVTSVATGNGLTGGTITSTGTLTMSGSYTGKFSATGLNSQNQRGNSGKVPQGHYAGGETVWEMDNTWSSQQLADYFNASVSNVYWTQVADAPGGNCIYINGGVNVGGVYGSGFPYLPVETNSQQQADYYMEVWIQNVGTNQTHYMGSNEFNESFGSLGGNPGSYGYWVMSNSNPGTGWTKYSAYIGGFSSSTVGMFELGTKYWTPMALLNYGAGSGTRACRISGWKVIKVQRAAKINMSGNDIIKIGDLIGEVGLDIKVDNGTTNAITIDNVGSTTFSGYTYFPNYLFHTGDTNTRIQFTTGTITLRGDTSIVLDGPTSTNANFTGTSATFSGDVTAATFNTLPIETARNNNANRIVRTNASGYVDFGWINTTSGATTSTIDRIYASNDSYIRYVTPATFRTQITDPYYAPATGGSYLPLAGGIMSGNIGRSAWNSGYQVGGYNNIGASHAKTNPIHVIGTSYEPTATGLSNMYGIGYTRGDASFLTGTSGWGMYVAADGNSRIFLDGQNGGIGTASGSWRAPIFYDSANTGYYVDPASYSSMWGVAVRGDLSTTGTGNQIFFYGSGGTTTSAIGFKNNGGNFANPTGNGDGWNTYLTMDTAGRGWVFRQGTGGTNFTSLNNSGWILNNGIWQANASMRSPIFYDSANTGYYGDFASSTWALNTAGSLKIIGGVGSDGDGASSVNQAVRVSMPNGASYSIDGGVTGALKIRLPVRANNTMWSMKVRIYSYSTNQTSEYTIGNYSYSNGGYNSSVSFQGAAGMEGRQVRWGNDGTYDCVWIGETNSSWSYPVVSVMDFNGGFRSGNAATWTNNWDISLVTSFGTVQTAYYPSTQVGSIGYATDSFRAPVFYDSDNTAYYGDFAGTSQLNVLNCAGTLTVTGTGGVIAPKFTDYNNGSFYLDPSSTGTSLNVAGDVVAYASSDIRFKNNITPITNALDKINKIGGYTFEWNEISHKETGKKDIGVIAQEVEEILPEIVQTRSNGYKAVDYQKLTALLIESVKEQQFIIDDLKSRIERLEKF